jgi:hypothetical protein
VQQQPRRRAGERPERAVPSALSWGTYNLTGRWFRTGPLFPVAKCVTLPAIPLFSWRTEPLTRVEKARQGRRPRPELGRWAGAVGTGGGIAATRTGGRASYAVVVLCGAGRAAVSSIHSFARPSGGNPCGGGSGGGRCAYYILHVSESTPNSRGNRQYGRCAGGFL